MDKLQNNINYFFVVCCITSLCCTAISIVPTKFRTTVIFSTDKVPFTFMIVITIPLTFSAGTVPITASSYFRFCSAIAPNLTWDRMNVLYNVQSYQLARVNYYSLDLFIFFVFIHDSTLVCSIITRIW